MRLSPRFKLSCSFAQRAAVCPLIVASAFKRRKMACALSALPPHPNNASFSPLHSASLSARSSSSPPLKGERLPCAPNISPGRAIFSPRACANMPAARPYARLPANHFSWSSFLCHAVKSLSAPVCLCSSPFLPLDFSSFPPFLSTCFGQIHRFFIRKVLAAFHWCAAKPICLPRPFFMRRVLSSKPMPPCFPFSLIGLSQAYPLNHAAFRPLRRRFLFS